VNQLQQKLWGLHRQKNELAIRAEFERLARLAMDHHAIYRGRGDVSRLNADDCARFASETDRVKLWAQIVEEVSKELKDQRERKEVKQ
jgi:hypothetical protein